MQDKEEKFSTAPSDSDKLFSANCVDRGASEMQIMVGKKLRGYYITFVFKPSFHRNSKSAMNSSEGDINLLPEHEKDLNFFEVCLAESSYVQKK